MTNSTAAREDFVAAMRKVPTVVSVITSYVDGRPWGLTVSAFCSVSADPPTIMVSLGRHTRTLADVSLAGRFGVSLLSDTQAHIAILAGQPLQPKYIDMHTPEWHLGSSSEYGWHGFGEAGEENGIYDPVVPSVSNARCHLSCTVSQVITVADHALVIGVVTDIAGPRADGSGPLLYHDRAFHQLGERIQPAPTR
jgi:flavin reductase ActVB